MESALIGLAGVLLGIFLNEYFRKKNRIENYSINIFERRLQVYEGLHKKLYEASFLIHESIETDTLTREEKHAVIEKSNLEVMNYMDEHDFYLNEDIIVHCGATLVGMTDIIDIEDEDNRNKELNNFMKNFKLARDMIKKESGVEELNKLFKSITRAEYSSDIIDYFRNLKKKHLS